MDHVSENLRKYDFAVIKFDFSYYNSRFLSFKGVDEEELQFLDEEVFPDSEEIRRMFPDGSFLPPTARKNTIYSMQELVK